MLLLFPTITMILYSHTGLTFVLLELSQRTIKLTVKKKKSSKKDAQTTLSALKMDRRFKGPMLCIDNTNSENIKHHPSSRLISRIIY